MASLYSLCLSKQQLFGILLIITFFSSSSAKRCYKSIISFGDSLADTGNWVILLQQNKPTPAFPPFGGTYFNRPTGRCCDGRLIVDFFAQKLGLPLVPPYFRDANCSNCRRFQKGVNFAVVGATALDNAYLARKGIINELTNVSLGVQLGLLKTLLPSLCSSSSGKYLQMLLFLPNNQKSCNEFLNNSLILMGEIGGNEFNLAFIQGIPSEVIGGLVPEVTKAISAAIEELIELGATTFVVPGTIPLGCLPVLLTRFRTSNKQAYDRYGCLIWLNDFAHYYNEYLKKELESMRRLHPRINIIYADYYQASMPLYLSPRSFGFKSTLTACCGGKGPYNVNVTLSCGDPGTKSCDDPSSYVNWDGAHFTDEAHRVISNGLLDGSCTIPRFEFPSCAS
ncbi:hypothetical protein Gogos_008139 [Gossypium gossypioides]|uniref:Uncharacterized protein n=1 Tax=Gossypium gossypioides TaxID=34282 RepID=A0A7J9CAS7_GOSGO|nr:hypothetical protein [Gossypium gossypioides]